MKQWDHSFRKIHPFVSFSYFILVFFSCFLSQNPMLLAICFGSALLYRGVMQGWRVALRPLRFALPMAVFVLLLNPLLNHNGMTPLFYVNDVPFTLEALLYGGAVAMTVTNTLLWFAVSNDIVDQDKIIYLLGKRLPTMALMVGMIFRMTDYFKTELQKIRFAQKGLGISTDQGTVKERLKGAGNLFLCLTGNGLEYSVDTAMAMRSRGYGLPGKSRMRACRFYKNDGRLFLVVLIFGTLLSWFFFSGSFQFDILPALSQVLWQKTQVIGYCLYAVFLNIPLFYNGLEELKWRYLHYKM